MSTMNSDWQVSCGDTFFCSGNNFLTRSFKGNLAKFCNDAVSPGLLRTSFAKIARRKLVQLNKRMTSAISPFRRAIASKLSKALPADIQFQRPVADRFSLDQDWTRGSRIRGYH